jgi:hypothetical protein
VFHLASPLRALRLDLGDAADPTQGV